MLSVRVSRRWVEAVDVVALELTDPQGAALPSFQAGSHIDVEVLPGLVRQYSLCNDPSERHRYIVGVLRVQQSRGGSAGVHERLQVGTTVRISAPRHQFALSNEATHHVLMAGGIGVTPILAMARSLETAGASFELHYCARSKSRAAFLDALQSTSLADRTHLHFDNEPDTRFNARQCLAGQGPGSHAYVCGPSGFMEHVFEAARAAGWPPGNLHREFFSPVQPTAGDGETPFELHLARSGRIVIVPAGATALQALRDAGIDVPSSCESGICGTCLTNVIEGTPDHRDSYLTDQERVAGDCFTPCCSRALGGRLKVDL